MTIAGQTSNDQVIIGALTAMFCRYNMVYFMTIYRKILVNQAVFAATSGSLTDQLTNCGRDIACHGLALIL
jgi:hypothetical protein